MKWTIEITETLQKSVEIEAESSEAAAKAAIDMYRNGVVVLSAADHVDTAFDFRQQ